MATKAKIRFKVNDVVNGGVYFAGDELVLDAESAQAIVNAGKAEYVPTAPTPVKSAQHHEEVKK